MPSGIVLCRFNLRELEGTHRVLLEVFANIGKQILVSYYFPAAFRDPR